MFHVKQRFVIPKTDLRKNRYIVILDVNRIELLSLANNECYIKDSQRSFYIFWFNSQKVGEKWIKNNGHYAAFRYVSFLSKRTCVKKGVTQCPDLV